MILLKEIQNNIEDLGYPCDFYEASDELPIPMLIIDVSEDEYDIEEKDKQYLTVSIMPEGEDLDGSEFIQFFYTSPNLIGSADLEGLKSDLFNKNRNLPLGHYNFNESESNIYFKYILVAPKNKPLDMALLNDVLDMCVYAVKNL
jgi:hypothetical protein